jgi:ribosomal-protein-alanine N-acetyltransferase
VSGGRVFLEAAGEEDLPALVALERRSFSHPWSAGSFRTEMRDPERGRIVVLRELAAEGQCRLLAFCAYQLVLDELHILDLAVLPERRRQGLGGRLLRRVLELGARRGARKALLEVRRSNWGAVELYRTVGFQLAGVRRSYYSNPPEDALLLQRELLEQTLMGAAR